MPYNPTPSSTFIEDIQTNVDANANTTTSSMDIRNASFLRFQVAAKTGTHTTHVIALEVSMDGTIWNTTEVNVTGTGMSNTSSRNVARYVRFKVSTVEGAASTVDLILQGK